ncbi:hypothetical protein AB9F39_37245, partial [Rhizobium leguminosarum]
LSNLQSMLPVLEAVVQSSKPLLIISEDVEKGNGWTLDRLREEGFPPAIISAVNALKRRLDEPDDDFVRRAASNQLALPVKRADL